MSTTGIVLTVDGGGTSTKSCAATRGSSPQPTILGSGTTGQSNPAIAGVDQSIASVLESARQAMTQCNESPARIVVGLAGIESITERDAIRTAIQREFGTTDVELISDIQFLLLAASRLPAVALISGTGSVAIGKDEAERIYRAGGRGFLVGDAGSGFWIAKQAVTRCIRALDGISPETDLTNYIADRIGSRQPENWTAYIHGQTENDARSVLAGMAPIVFDAAESQVDSALRIVDDAARELAKLVKATTFRMNLNAPFQLLLAGSVLTNQAALRSQITQRLDPIFPDYQVRLIHSPAEAVACQLVLEA